MHVTGVEKDMQEINKAIAKKNRKLFEENGVFAINLIGAIGSGKTSLIEALYERLKDFKIGVIVGDVISNLDAKRLDKLNIRVIGVDTGRECHLDAHMIQHSLGKIPLKKINLLFIENVRNLIRPVDFDLGAQKSITIVSVSEGGDTVKKHPMISVASDAVIINKVDIADAVNVNPQKMRNDALKINPNTSVFLTSIKTWKGLGEVECWIRNEVKNAGLKKRGFKGVGLKKMGLKRVGLKKKKVMEKIGGGGVEESRVEKDGIEESRVEKEGIEESRVEKEGIEDIAEL